MPGITRRSGNGLILEIIRCRSGLKSVAAERRADHRALVAIILYLSRTGGLAVVVQGIHSIQIRTVPELEHEQLPQPQLVVTPSGEVLVQQALDLARLEVAALPGAGREQHVLERQTRSVPRNQTPSGTPNPCFFRVEDRRRAAGVPRRASAGTCAGRRAASARAAGAARTRRAGDRAAARATRSSAPCSCGRPSSARPRADRCRSPPASCG